MARVGINNILKQSNRSQLLLTHMIMNAQAPVDHQVKSQSRLTEHGSV